MMKRLATECSRPIASSTMVEMGNHMPTSLPTRLLDALARKTARLIIQLYKIALTMVCPTVPQHLLRAVDVQAKGCSSGVVEDEASVPSGDSKKTATDDITNDGDDKTLCKFSPRNHILHVTISLYLAAATATRTSRVVSKELV